MFRLKRDGNYRSVKRQIVAGSFVVALCLIALVVSIQYVTKVYTADADNSHTHHSRNLLQTDAPVFKTSETYKIPCAEYPPDLFTKDQLESGAWVLHVLGLLYMFVAIAIVCDEFFVPSIEVIVDKLGVSPDVAGATFMAAGGSAPELFTSFFGTFVSKSSVGFGTIVGSAVFNVLFVIGCCAIFSNGDLVLTWYPFARDSIYYCVSLCVLAGFFYGDEIYFYEALILFLLYIGYVVLMINNAKLYDWIDRKFVKTDPRTRAATAAEQLAPRQPISTFSVSLWQMMTKDADLAHIAGVHMVSRIKGDVKATFRQIDADGNGTIDKEEFKTVLYSLSGAVTDEELDACFKEIDEDGNGTIEFEEFQKWYLRSENRFESDVKEIFNRFDRDGDGCIDAGELESLVTACQPDGSKPTEEDLKIAREALDADGDGLISRDEFMDWYKGSKFFETAKRHRDTLTDDAEQDEGDGVSLAFPEGWKSRVMYCITAPIVFTLYFTVPDVRKPKWRSWWPAGFLMSIAWLGVYSYFMVWWATVFGKIVGIPDNIMGLTILAAGTSVPDLITSVLVAKQGMGDMAVSSSIGSNIFDILVGLPLPWIFATLVWWPKLDVDSNGIFISIFILFAMIGAVLAIIYCSKWRMTKLLGYSMFVLYLLFCIQDITRYYLSGNEEAPCYEYAPE